MSGSDINLGGTWKGIFQYPRLLPPNQFDAELRDQNAALTGESFETSDSGQSKGRRLVAILVGSRVGSRVDFTKTYDELNRSRGSVHYEGWVSQDGNEISGTWSILGSWSGTFLMMRGQPARISEERKIAEPVR